MDDLKLRTAPRDLSATTRAVADDLTAIFGAGVRTPAEVPPRPRVERRERKARGPLIAVAALGLVGTAITAGVYAGKDVTRAPAATPTTSTRERPERTAASPPAEQVEELAGAFEAVPPADDADRTTFAPDDTAPPPPPPEDAAPAPAPAAPLPAPAPTLGPLPPPAVARAEPAAPAPAPAPAPAVAAEAACEDERAPCFVARIEQADERLAAAFDRAVAAGVRTRILRGYEREWGRARERSLERPRDSLRLYGMITADLRILANEATGGRAPPQ